MGTKISALTTTGSAPSGAYIPLAYEGENYKVAVSVLVGRQFGARETKSYNTIYYTDVDAIITARYCYSSSWPDIIAYADPFTPPTTLRLRHDANDDGGGCVSMTFIVRGGEYWKVTIDGSYTAAEIVYTPMSGG
jgi:hypothetical protein